ncbi:hypothetical protein TELCIR_20517, partial [Teladorsagia circumcincta]
ELYQRFGWEDDFHNDSLSRWQKLKPKMWRLFDEPSSSRGAKVIAIISVFFLITAILVFCLKTHPGLRISEISGIGNLSREARAANHYRYRPAPLTVDKMNSKAHPGASAKELMLLVFFLVLGVVVFASLVYYAERVEPNPNNEFQSIPIGLWWA